MNPPKRFWRPPRQPWNIRPYMAVRERFELSLTESKSVVLPLHYPTIYGPTRRARNASVLWNQHPTTFSLLSRFPPYARRLESRKRYIEYGFNSNNEDGRKPRCRSPHHFWCQPISSRCLPPGKLTSQINRLLCVRGLEPGRLRAAALDIGERKSLALTLYQTDFTINHVINVMKHEHPSLFSFAHSARGLIVRTIPTWHGRAQNV